MAKQLTRYQLEQYIAQRETVGRDKFLPVVDNPAHAMALIAYCGRYDQIENEQANKPEEPIYLRFAIVPRHTDVPQESHRKWLNSVRSSLSQVRRAVRDNGQTPENFSIIDHGWVWHSDEKHIVITVQYQHKSNKRLQTEIQRMLANAPLQA